VVATPDHWHALLTILACAAGKDVYVEKPLTVAIDEGKWMLQAEQKYQRIVVVGTQRRHNRNVLEARKTVESGVLGKIHMARLSSVRNVYPGFGKTPVENPPADLDYEMWLGPAPKRPYQAHRSLYHFRWFWDYSGGQMTNLGAHSIDQLQYVMNAKGPVLVASTGGRFVLEDDGETPDVQDAWFLYPPSPAAPNGWVLAYTIREANAYRDVSGGVIMGTKGNLLFGSNQIISEMRGDPVDQIPRFLGHPVGGPVYSNTPPVPWIEGVPTAAPAGRGAGGEGAGRGAAPPAAQGRGAQAVAGRGAAGGAPAGFPGEAALYLNHRDFIHCIRTRQKPLCDLLSGHRVAITCNLANLSLRLGGRAIRWDPDKEQVVGDREAAAMCTPRYRAPWDSVLRSVIKV
jgi:predicted dehydrogenase